MKSQYTQDVDFNSGFGALQTPVHLYTAAAIAGVRAPRINRPFRYLDLACGNGLTLCLLADAYPKAEFVGIDLNANHIADARARVETGKLANITFHEMDVLDVDPAELGQFEFCTMSGAYAWLDPGRRDATRALMGTLVREGGVVYLDYSSQPGNAQVSPLYHVLQQLGSTLSGSSAKRLTEAAEILNDLSEEGARFFKVHQVASARLKNMLENPPEDEAHEVFNFQEQGLWSHEVISAMERNGLRYAVNAGLHHNLPALEPVPGSRFRGLALPEPLQQMLFDIRWNVAQRRDIYVRTNSDFRPEDIGSLLEELPIYVGHKALQRKSREGLRQHFPGYDFCSQSADKFAAIASEARTFGELLQRLSDADVPREEALSLTQHFLAARLISVAVSQSPEASDSGSYTINSALNRNILVEDIGAEYARPFSSPVAGSRVMLPLKDRLYLWALLGLDLSVAWNRLGDLQTIFTGESEAQLSQEQFIKTIKTSLPVFRQHAVPELIRLGVLQYV